MIKYIYLDHLRYSKEMHSFDLGSDTKNIFIEKVRKATLKLGFFLCIKIGLN